MIDLWPSITPEEHAILSFNDPDNFETRLFAARSNPEDGWFAKKRDQNGKVADDQEYLTHRKYLNDYISAMRAAMNGEAWAQHDLGLRCHTALAENFRYGRGPEDRKWLDRKRAQAVTWFTLAARQGHDEALSYLIDYEGKTDANRLAAGLPPEPKWRRFLRTLFQ